MSCQLLTFICCVIVSTMAAHKDRADQLKRMKQYELIHLKPQAVDDDTKTLEFDAFDQHYVVELTRKPLSAPSYVLHSNVDTADHLPFSSNTDSCHFSGRVTNAEEDSVVSVSLCDGRGIRGRISVFGETLIMKPSAYYLDLALDKLANHSLDDELLVFRLSEFETPEIADNEGVTFSDDDDVDQFMERRRLYNSYNEYAPAETEMALIIGPVRTSNYKEDYGDNWYSQLFQDTADLVNSVDEIYAATNWNAGGRHSIGGRGSVRVVFSEIHIIHEFTGIHYSLRPEKLNDAYYECDLADDEYDDSKWCYIDGQKFLYSIRSWVGKYFDAKSYDNVQFITDMSFWWDSCAIPFWSVCSRTLGWGAVGTLCKGSTSVSVDTYADGFAGEDTLVGTVAHELGHNFGMNHDGQSGPASWCDAEDGLMGYGSTKDRFSVCSLDGMRDYFEGNGYGLRCLSTGWEHSVATNVNDDGSQIYGCGGAGCIYISGLPSVYKRHEGYYEPMRSIHNYKYEKDCYDDHAYYKGPNDEYLCYDNGASRWYLSWSLCTSPFIMSSETGGDVLSAADWSASYRGSFYVMGSVQFSDCGGNQAFSEDAECLDSNPMGNEICISTADHLWGSDRTFLVLDDLCLNEHPVYHFLMRNSSEFVEYDNFTWSNESTFVEEVIEVNYYVHYELVYLDVTGNATVGHWMLTRDEISENYLAFCDEEDLAECTVGSWTVHGLFVEEMDSQSEDESNQTISDGDGYIMDIIDEIMTVRDGNCNTLYDAEGSNADGDGTSLSVVVLAVLAVVIICIALFVARKYMINGGRWAVGDDKHSIPDAEAMEIEVEVAMPTDSGKAELITTTQV